MSAARPASRPASPPAPPAPPAPRPAPSPALLRRLLRAKDRMDAASDEAWPVQRLADLCGLTEAYFARAFKAAFGLPPHRYLLSRRIERACALLRDTELSVTEVALQTGWDSLGTFGRTFRDITGSHPAAVREQLRRETPVQALAGMPLCHLMAAQRPDLRSAVSEKRRQAAAGTTATSDTPSDKELT